MSSPPLLAARDLAAGYRGRGGRTVLRGVSVELGRDELVAVLGPNGAGKSTLLKTLAGMLPPLAGAVEVGGRPIRSLSARELAWKIGVVLPERFAPGMLSAEALVALGRHPHTGWTGKLGPADHTVVHRAMAAVDVAHLAGRQVAELSDGERQKVMIARALAQEPAVLVLDEPTAFLDLPGRVDVMSLLGVLARRAGAGAVLLSTHDLDLALRSADSIWLVRRTGDVETGTPEALLRSGALADAFASDTLTDYLPDPETLRVWRDRVAHGKPRR